MNLTIDPNATAMRADVISSIQQNKTVNINSPKPARFISAGFLYLSSLFSFVNPTVFLSGINSTPKISIVETVPSIAKRSRNNNDEDYLGIKVIFSGDNSYNTLLDINEKAVPGRIMKFPIYDSISEKIEKDDMVFDMMKDENLCRLQTISSFSDNWNGYGAKPFSNEFINYCKFIINNLNIQPLLTPTGRNSIQIEYELDNGKYLEFEIFNHKISVFRIDENGSESEDNIDFDKNTIEYFNKEIHNFYA